MSSIVYATGKAPPTSSSSATLSAERFWPLVWMNISPNMLFKMRPFQISSNAFKMLPRSWARKIWTFKLGPIPGLPRQVLIQSQQLVTKLINREKVPSPSSRVILLLVTRFSMNRKCSLNYWLWIKLENSKAIHRVCICCHKPQRKSNAPPRSSLKQYCWTRESKGMPGLSWTRNRSNLCLRISVSLMISLTGRMSGPFSAITSNSFWSRPRITSSACSPT